MLLFRSESVGRRSEFDRAVICDRSSAGSDFTQKRASFACSFFMDLTEIEPALLLKKILKDLCILLKNGLSYVFTLNADLDIISALGGNINDISDHSAFNEIKNRIKIYFTQIDSAGHIAI